MKRLALLIGLLIAGCGAPAEPEALAQEQVVLRDVRGEVTLTVEVADDHASRETGLMNRDRLCERCGMIFVWDEPMPVMMWMKNTRIPLDMAFIRDGRVVGVATGKPYDETTLPAPMPVDMVLEVGGGKLAEWGIGIGSELLRN